MDIWRYSQVVNNPVFLIIGKSKSFTHSHENINRSYRHEEYWNNDMEHQIVRSYFDPFRNFGKLWKCWLREEVIQIKFGEESNWNEFELWYFSIILIATKIVSIFQLAFMMETLIFYYVGASSNVHFYKFQWAGKSRIFLYRSWGHFLDLSKCYRYIESHCI